MVGGGCEYHAKWHGKSSAIRKQYFNSISCNIVGSYSEMLWRSRPNERNILQHPKMLQKKKKLTIFEPDPIHPTYSFFKKIFFKSSTFHL